MGKNKYYEYLLALCAILGEEYTHRYGKVHKSVLVVESLPIPVLNNIEFSEPPKCVHEDFKSIEDTVDAYRKYYERHFCV